MLDIAVACASNPDASPGTIANGMVAILLGDPAHPEQFQSEVIECCSGNSEGFSPSAFAAANLDSDEAPVLFATQNAGFSDNFIQTWRSHGTETATATFNNMSVPDLPTIYFRSKYWVPSIMKAANRL